MKKEFCKIIDCLGRKHDKGIVFSDFCQMSAIALRLPYFSSASDKAAWDRCIDAYNNTELALLDDLLRCTVEALERCPHDFLGSCYHELNLYDEKKGQFFTPDQISQLMTLITLGDLKTAISPKGYLTISEPTCGAGGIVIAIGEEFKRQGINPINSLYITAQDIDLRACNMCFIQMSLLAIPGVVIHGNTLLVETRQAWPTVGHFLGQWELRFRAERLLDIIRSTSKGHDEIKKTDNAPSVIIPDPDISLDNGQMVFKF